MYTTGQFAKLIHKTVRTLQTWDKNNILKPEIRTQTNRRLYSHAQYLKYINEPITNLQNKIVAYCRVSSSSQHKELQSQINFIRNFAFNKGEILSRIYNDIGSGLNYKRKEFLLLTKDIIERKISKLIIAHKDRLVRFGFEWFEWLCNLYDVELLVINDDRLSPTEEMTKDLMDIIHVFSCRLYGLRSYKTKIKEACNANE